MRQFNSRNLAGDSDGIEAYPLQLLIIAIVLAITLPIIFSAFNHYQSENDRQLLETEVLRIENALVQVYNQGLGATLYFEVDLPASTDYLKIGGSLDDKVGPYIIIYKVLNNQEEYENINDGRVSIPTTDIHYGTMELKDGHYTIKMEKMITDKDLDGDGSGGDFYIGLEKVYNV